MYEGLIVRISGFMRKIHLIVIHCSATRADKELTAFDLDTMHRRRGFNGTGYHYYIRKDGTTHLTRPVERIGAHAKGFNAESIGICYEAAWTAGDARRTHGHRNSGQRSGCWCISCKRDSPVAGCAVIATCRRIATVMERLSRRSGSRRARALR